VLASAATHDHDHEIVATYFLAKLAAAWP